MIPALPPAAGTPYRLAFVCLGNICRSPMAHVVLEEMVNRAGLAARVAISSAGTGDWHLGEPMDPRAAAQLVGSSYDPSAHRARQFGPEFCDQDLLLAMDHANLRDMRAMAPGLRKDQVRLFRDFDPLAEPDAEVPDPYAGGEKGFVEVLHVVERTCRSLVTALEAAL